MNDLTAPVYVDPYDEGAQAAREGLIDARLLAMPAAIMAERLSYSEHDWRRFRRGALAELMKRV